jgi:hypothetical protein
MTVTQHDTTWTTTPDGAECQFEVEAEGTVQLTLAWTFVAQERDILFPGDNTAETDAARDHVVDALERVNRMLASEGISLTLDRLEFS